MTADKLEAILNKVLREITIIKANWFIWKGLREEMQEGARYENLLEISPCFLSNLSDTVVYTEFHNVDDYEKYCDM